MPSDLSPADERPFLLPRDFDDQVFHATIRLVSGAIADVDFRYLRGEPACRHDPDRYEPPGVIVRDVVVHGIGPLEPAELCMLKAMIARNHKAALFAVVREAEELALAYPHVIAQNACAARAG